MDEATRRRMAKRRATLSARAMDRFWAKVDKTDDCWLWTGFTMKHGYGQLTSDGVRQLVHRFAYERLVGPIPEGLEIDHLCRVRNCVRPDHLEAVSRRENVHRSESWAGKNARKTTCPQGHDLIPSPYGIGRICPPCREETSRRRKRRAA